MVRASDLSPAQVGWTSEWYFRREALEAARGRIVDHQSSIALAQRMGTGLDLAGRLRIASLAVSARDEFSRGFAGRWGGSRAS
jgi:TnpA family transposase